MPESYFCAEKENSMRYEEFKQVMIEKISMAVPCETNVSVKTVRKNNGIVLDAVNIIKPQENITPTFYLTRYYERYCRGTSVDELVQEILRDRGRFAKTGIRSEDILTADDIRSRVFFKVINYDMNAVLLREIPHRKVLDLAIVYYYKVDESILPDARILLRKEHLSGLGIREEELHAAALKNTEEGRPAVLETLGDKIMGLRGDPCSVREASPDEMYVLTNSEGMYGASTLFYKNTGKMLRERFAEDLFLIPSSVHEWIILPDRKRFCVEELNELICQVNEVVVEPDEVLSSHVYIFEHATMNLGFLSF